MKKIRMILAVTLALIVSMGMVVNVAASDGEVRFSTTIDGQERQVYFPADSEAAVAYHRDVKPLLPTGRGKMSDAAIAAMDKWKAKYVTPQADQFATPHQTTPSNSVKILTDDELKSYADKVFELVNAEREKAGLAPISYHEDVAEAAMIRAQEIVSSYTHTRPDGSKCFTVLDEYGVERKWAGENIACGFSTPKRAMQAWMNSDGHSKNILNEKATAIGVGVYQYEDGKIGWVQLIIQEK